MIDEAIVYFEKSLINGGFFSSESRCLTHSLKTEKDVANDLLRVLRDIVAKYDCVEETGLTHRQGLRIN